jgi:hypothetical protein
MKTLGRIFLLTWLCLTPAMSGLYQPVKDTCDFPATGSFHEPGIYQVVISEIMADPNPPVGLPNAEYIELFNRGESAVSLTGCRLLLGTNRRILPGMILESHAYLIAVDAGDTGLFTSLGKVLPVLKMPPILNSGLAITLESPSGKVIHSVEFNENWYRSKNKDGGGWSLEMIDPDNICGKADNWCESKDPRGGTPGSPNSVHALNPDRLRPKLLRATMNADSSVLLHFSESMDSASTTDRSSYSANHGLLHPARVDPVEPGYSSIAVTFGSALNSAVTYNLTLLNTLKDCAGNPLDYNAHAEFAIPEAADSFDVVINEVLFDTPEGMSEFIELYNRSQKSIDLAEFSLALCDPFSDSIIRKTPLKSNSFLLFPGCYVAISRFTDHLPNPVYRIEPSTLVEQPALFTLPDQEGEIALISTDLQIIDRFRYSRHMHSAFLSETRGISLERIRADRSTNDISNWYSASSTNGYATPGYENSQGLSPETDKDNITLIPAVFSPDGDGTDDFAVMTLEPGKSGFMANILIFDIRGIAVKTLASNELLGTRTVLTWDGTRNDQTLADIGIYLIYIELFNQSGIVKKCRKVVTLARKL